MENTLKCERTQSYLLRLPFGSAEPSGRRALSSDAGSSVSSTGTFTGITVVADADVVADEATAAEAGSVEVAGLAAPGIVACSMGMGLAVSEFDVVSGEAGARFEHAAAFKSSAAIRMVFAGEERDMRMEALLNRSKVPRLPYRPTWRMG